MLPAAPLATAPAPTLTPHGRRDGVPPARRVERRAPAFLAVPSELEVVALAGHADDDAADAKPAAEERAEGGGRGVPPSAGGQNGDDEDVAAGGSPRP
jgi:hypothetical protein